MIRRELLRTTEYQWERERKRDFQTPVTFLYPLSDFSSDHIIFYVDHHHSLQLVGWPPNLTVFQFSLLPRWSFYNTNLFLNLQCLPPGIRIEKVCLAYTLHARVRIWLRQLLLDIHLVNFPSLKSTGPALPGFLNLPRSPTSMYLFMLLSLQGTPFPLFHT